ncbi:ABC transporter permease [Ornithinimicrobium murale]|uniref:ABC transporter permease n=1 Tax=Ornithinimicrobium murale TaxID=1050153 RepID=UPI000E0CCED4|nr:ABC transporter permease [Ornithinimicrobium murale]
MLLTRILRSVVVLALVGLLTMALPSLTTGNPAIAALGMEASREQIAEFLSRLNLDDPAPQRLAAWLGNAAQGDLGSSLTTGREVAEEIITRLPITLELLALGQVLALAITLPVAMASAWRPGSILDRFATTVAFVLISIPVFVLGLLAIALFAVMLNLLPATGWVHPLDDPVGHVRHLVLPVLTVGLSEAAVLVRVLRADLITTLGQPYVMAARSRGMSLPRLMLTRALRPSSLSTVTLVGLGFGAVFGGSALIETVFAVPGMGRLAVSAIGARDFPVIEAIIIFSAVAVLLAMAIVDFLYTRIDPRTRRGRS